MTVASAMTKTPACCTPGSSLTDVARMMVANDCGQIPVVEDLETRKLAGVITDRDIAIRIVAEGRNPAEANAGDCMTAPCISVTAETSLQDCCGLMEANKVRRLPVIDAEGGVVGIVSLADVSRVASAGESAEVLKQVSANI